jgi:hypothetical protein
VQFYRNWWFFYYESFNNFTQISWWKRNSTLTPKRLRITCPHCLNILFVPHNQPFQFRLWNKPFKAVLKKIAVFLDIRTEHNNKLCGQSIYFWMFNLAARNVTPLCSERLKYVMTFLFQHSPFILHLTRRHGEIEFWKSCETSSRT